MERSFSDGEASYPQKEVNMRLLGDDARRLEGGYQSVVYSDDDSENVVIDEFGEMKMNAIYSYHLTNFIELEEILDFINGTFELEIEDEELDTFEDFNNDVDDLLEDMGIETE